MQTLTRNGTARLAIIAIAAALIMAIAAPIVAFAQTAPNPRPTIESVALVGEAPSREQAKKPFAPGDVITVNVHFDNRWDVRVVNTPDATDDDPAWQKLRLQIGAISRDAAYVGQVGDSPNIRQFAYTIQEGDHTKVRSVEAREFLHHNLEYVYDNDAASGCEGGELSTQGSLFLSMFGALIHLLDADGQAALYTPYTCDDHASWLHIPNPHNTLPYEGLASERTEESDPT